CAASSGVSPWQLVTVTTPTRSSRPCALVMYRTNPPKSLLAVAFMGTCFAIIRAALFLAAKILPGPQDLSDDPRQLVLIGLDLGQHAPNDDRHPFRGHFLQLGVVGKP